MQIETAQDLAKAVKARTVKTDAVMYPDGGFDHPNKQIQTNEKYAGMPVQEYAREQRVLTLTGRYCWSYGGVGNCYEMLAADRTLHGWFSLAHVKPVK